MEYGTVPVVELGVTQAKPGVEWVGFWEDSVALAVLCQ